MTVSGDSFFDSLDAETRSQLGSLGQPRHYPAGTTLFNEGESSDRVIMVSDGLVKVSYFTAEGKEVLLGIRGPGTLLGDMSAFDGRPRSATITAMEAVEAVVFQAQTFQDFVLSSKEATLALIKLISSRLREADRKRIEFGAMDTLGRVATRIVEMADRFGEESEEGIRIAVSLSQQDLAGWTGSSREAVSKALQNLRDRGIVRTHRRGITVLDREALDKRAG